MHELRAALWVHVPADVDFVARFPPNRRFLRRDHHISRIDLRGNATNELSATTATTESRKKSNMLNKQNNREF